MYDLDSNNVVDWNDHRFWVHYYANTYIGDADLNGAFESADFVQVFAEGKYEDDIAGNATWGSGDWDGDGDFTSSDFVIAFQDGGYEQGPRTGVAAVPEPWARYCW